MSGKDKLKLNLRYNSCWPYERRKRFSNSYKILLIKAASTFPKQTLPKSIGLQKGEEKIRLQYRVAKDSNR